MVSHDVGLVNNFSDRVLFWRNSYVRNKTLLSVQNVEKSYKTLGEVPIKVLKGQLGSKTGVWSVFSAKAAQAKRLSPG